MIKTKDNHVNHLVYVVHHDVDSFVLFNSSFLVDEDLVLEFEKEGNNT